MQELLIISRTFMKCFEENLVVHLIALCEMFQAW